MTEQSHKREMNEALLGDFERLRARRQRRLQMSQAPVSPRPERVVLTPPRGSAQAGSGLPERPPADERRRPWLRSVFRRNG